jgi:flagellar biosynthetic protein FliR
MVPFFDLVDRLPVLVPGYMLVFTRLSAMLMTLPIFSYPMISVKTRIMFGLILTVIIGPLLNLGTIPHITNLWVLFGLVGREIIIGLIIGFGARIIFEGFAIAGGIVGLQMGMGIANVMDPNSREQIPIITQFWLPIMILLLLAVDGHHFFIKTMFGNFQMIPLGIGELSPEAGETIVKGGSRIYEIGVRFAAPSIAFLILIDAGVGFMARTMPQLNVFFITLPLKILSGLIMLLVSLNVFQILFDSVYDEIIEFTGLLIRQLSGS